MSVSLAAREATDTLHIRELIRLKAQPGVGDAQLRRLLEARGTERDAIRRRLSASSSGRVSASRERRVDRALEVMDALRLEVIRFGSPEYPRLLKEIADPPALLFARGDTGLLGRPCVAVVGSRRSTEYGLSVARRLGHELAAAGVVVVSGLARGIDGAAHAGALEGGTTLGVVGCGVDVMYPPEHQTLQEEIAVRGLLLSEFLPGEPPLAYHFPRRNRVIAGLCLGIVVVEAPQRSGALITANLALDMGREVFAVPGPITRDTSAGANALIRDGAALATCAADILEELGLQDRVEKRAEAASRSVPAMSPGMQPLWAALDEEPRHIDELAARSGTSTSAALVMLLDMELSGRVRQVPGKRFQRAS